MDGQSIDKADAINTFFTNTSSITRGVATLGSSRHVPSHHFHKILRKICIKWNVYIFLLFNDISKIENKIIVIRFDLPSYTAIINAIQTAVIDQFIALKNRKLNFIWSKPNKIVFSCRILQISYIWSFTKILLEFSVNGFYSLIIITYGTTYSLSFWYHTTKYINVLNYALQFRPGIRSDL